MRVHYQLLETLLELERAPSFAAAAATLRVSTSAVSQRLQLLEHQLGFALFERFGRRNRMTAAGRELCATVRESFQQIDESVAKMRGDDIEARGNVRIDLTAKEFALLSVLARRQGEVLSKTAIAELVWDMNFDSNTNVVEVAIKRLRAKIDGPYPTSLLHTVRGMGYVLEPRREGATEAVAD